MRVAMIILSILSLVFIGAISWSLMGQDKWSFPLSNLSEKKTDTSLDNIALETWKNQVKTDEKLERLTDLVEELAKKNGTYTPESITPVATGTEIKPLEPAIKPSGKLLALLMPTVTPELEKNNGIYGLYIFDTNVPYSTYKDLSIPLIFMPLGVNYETFLKNMKSLGGKPYSVNEVKNLPFRAFFINSETPTDTTVRLVIEMEGQTIALETPKARYELVKNLLLGRGGTNIKTLTQSGSTTTKPVINQPQKTVTPVVNTASTGTSSAVETKTGKINTTSSINVKTGTTIRIIN